VNYQVQLQGYDQSPEFTKASHVTYNHLGEGRYVFTLRASDRKGATIAAPVTLEILIKTPIWKKGWFYGVLLVVLIATVYLFIRRREYRYMNEKRILEKKVEERTVEIQRQRDAIAQQRDMIRQKNMRITSSINYASHIQEAIFPSPDLINRLFPENFILSRPRDIVSGDFYWVAESKDKVVFAVGDCTGHGVPGAFLSILGITLLNELVNVEGIIRSDILITRFQEKLTHALRHTGNEYLATDGIDIALCIIDRYERRIQFTGAMNDLVFIRKSQLDVLRANRISVSSGFEVPELFTLQEFEYQQGDLIYLFSDGYTDQFGGPRNKKFSSRRMYASLLENAALPLPEQCLILEQSLDEWMRGYSQTDDITVMGVRL
jgi:serine phosphatase RsbU (regulator of sigma subunit)